MRLVRAELTEEVQQSVEAEREGRGHSGTERHQAEQPPSARGSLAAHPPERPFDVLPTAPGEKDGGEPEER